MCNAYRVALVVRNIVKLMSLILLAATASKLTAQDSEPTLDAIKAAVKRSLPLLEKGAHGSITHRPQCFTCHNQGVPILALTTVRQRGFSIDAEHLNQQVEFIAKFLEKNRDRFREGKGTGGQVATAGYAMWSLQVGDAKLDETTEAVIDYLLQFQAGLGHWEMTSHRPPSEHSHFTANYLAIRALKHFGKDTQKERVNQRIEQARDWLIKTSANDTEDRVFRLWALQLAEANEMDLKVAKEELWASQRDDGGWAQDVEMESDAYATGTALASLHLAGGLPTSDVRYRQGLSFLLKQQLDDGEWYVQSRSKPFQTYFESGFPHGNDQFISITASGWATIALALACPLGDDSTADGCHTTLR